MTSAEFDGCNDGLWVFKYGIKNMLTITEKAGRAPVESKGGEVWMVQGERTL